MTYLDALSREFDKNTWKCIEKFFTLNSGYQLVKHQIESFNDFILRKLKQIIHGFNPIEIYHQYIEGVKNFKYKLVVEISNPVINKPTINEKDGSIKYMTPNDARLRNFTYSSNLYVDLMITAKTLKSSIIDGKEVFNDKEDYLTETTKLQGVILGRIPIMYKSEYCIQKNNYGNNNECKYDYGGYFIINGNEKVIISQDRISENKTYVFSTNKLATYSHVAEIRSVQEAKLGVPKITTLKLASKPNQFGRNIRANIHHIKNDIPVFILLKALGLSNDKEIMTYIVHDLEHRVSKIIIQELVACIEEANTIHNQTDALEYLSKYLNITGYPKEFLNDNVYRRNIVKTILRSEFLPHVGEDYLKKAFYVCSMINRLIKCYLGLREYDDRDSYINKRVDSPGVLMANLFRQCYGKVIKDMKSMIQKEINNGGWRTTNKFVSVINKVNISKIIKSTTIDSGLRYGLSTGNWGIKNNKNKQGVAQVLNRMTYNATISHLRRINTPIEKSGKLVQPRKLHSTQWGIICPSECFDPETPILSWEGTIKTAKDIIIGDCLIDDIGNAVKVQSICSGFKNMYEIVPEKVNFMSYTVTDNHILTLKVKNNICVRNHRGKRELSWFDNKNLRYKYKNFDNIDDLNVFRLSLNNDDVIDITIENYLSLPNNVQKNLYLFKSDGINWEHKEIVLDPYILGMWLGDGLSSGYGFVTADKELLYKWIEWGVDNDATIKKSFGYKYHISSTINNTQTGMSCNKTEQAPLKKLLTKYDLVNNKHIPLEYLINDRKTRLLVLAGLVDTDGNVRANGHEIRISQGKANYQIIYDAEFLARSLGFSCHVNEGICTYTVNGEKRQKPYKELYITGRYLYEIPTVLPRKRLNKFDNPITEKRCSSFLQSLFKLIKKEIEPFVGWQLEGNGRFLLGDMSISHNTPEGASVGLVKNMAMMCSITISSDSTNVRETVLRLGVVAFCHETVHLFGKHTHVIINGDIMGTIEDPLTFYETIKKEKRKGSIGVYTSISWNIFDNQINISTEGGRCVRPLYIVKNNEINLNNETVKWNWNDLVIGHKDKSNVIEFLDVDEMNSAMIAMKFHDLYKGPKGHALPIKYTHLEMHPSMILGVLASAIPFSDHNQSPRNCYQSAQSKQAIGINASNYKKRYDTLTHILNYPHKPLVRPRITTFLNNDSLPNGMNVIVAIATFTGYNQEDSVIMNQSAVDRGMFTSTYFRTYKEQNNKNHSNGEEEIFTKPNIQNLEKKKPYKYSKIRADGFVPENTFVESGDIIIGKCMPSKNGTLKDNSIPLKNNETGYIDRNCYNDNHFININGDGYSFCKVRIRTDRIPTIGDKFSSRSGQKGTVGMMYRQEDLPFTKNGLVPDIIMNPHAIPSRMTIGQLIESIMGKVCANLGVFGDATPFSDLEVTDIAELLESRCGLERYGNEIMYDPRTGNMLDTDIFIGPTYYQRLKHMTVDKIHSRSNNGPIVMLTRQPAEGRARDGGLRVGEMEGEAILGHGAMSFLKERYMDCSDNYRAYICKKCGAMVGNSPENNIYDCGVCNNKYDFSEVRIPYAYKLLAQELESMNLGIRYITA